MIFCYNHELFTTAGEIQNLATLRDILACGAYFTLARFWMAGNC